MSLLRRNISFSVITEKDRKAIDQLRLYCDSTGINFSKIVREVLIKWINTRQEILAVKEEDVCR